LYSITLYDTDLREEVWVESAAHHGPIYELKWSRDDQFLLSCSGDGTCKVWDMLPVSYRSSNTMGFGALNSSAVGRVNGSFDPSIQATGARPPGLLHTLVASPPVYTYTGVFQDQAAPTQPRQAADTGGRSAAVPRIITGAADGKLRVWDGGVMVGYVVVTSKDKNDTEAVDYSPHEGQINSIVIDERSRFVTIKSFLKCGS
jgi:WD40 repeat protein